MPRSSLRLRDWLFSGRAKRLVIEHLVLDRRDSWTQTDLARASGAARKGSIDGHLAALVQLAVLRRRDGRYYVEREHPLFQALAAVVAALASVEDIDLDRPP